MIMFFSHERILVVYLDVETKFEDKRIADEMIFFNPLICTLAINMSCKLNLYDFVYLHFKTFNQ